MMVERVVIINDMATARGGATALALLSAELLRRRGIAVSYITGDSGKNAALVELGVEVIAAGGAELLKQPAMQSAISGINNRRTRRLVAGFVKTRDTAGTIYHVHGWAQTLSPSIFKPLQPVAARTFVHAHDFFLACPNAVFFDFQKSRDCTRTPLGLSCVLTNCDKRNYGHKMWRLLRQRALVRAFDQALPWAGILMIHPGMRAQMIGAGYPGGRLKVVPNPVHAFSDTRIRAAENRDFVFVGRLEPDKGILELINAVKLANVPLTVIGDGPLYRPLMQKHPDIRFTGWKNRAAIGDIVQTARALVMPSRFREPFGLVAIEALQSGLPVILPDNALLAAEIIAGGFGMTCNIHDPRDFAACLGRMRDLGRSEIERMSLRGFSASAKLALSPQDWVGRQIAFYSQALENAGEGR